jgi:N-acetylmuramoyl-L-alanine amidase
VEAAYITNPVEEKFLRQERFQLNVTQAIVAAVKKFIPLLAAKDLSGG